MTTGPHHYLLLTALIKLPATNDHDDHGLLVCLPTSQPDYAYGDNDDDNMKILRIFPILTSLASVSSLLFIECF